MPHTLKKLDNSEVELIITVNPADYQKHLSRAAERLAERANIKGFRKGKAPYDVIKKEFGEMAILQEALEDIIKNTFYQATQAEKLQTIGMPKIDVNKLAPGNDVVYKAVVGLMPKVDLANLKKIKVERKVKPVEQKNIDETLNALRGLNAKEVLKPGPAEGMEILFARGVAVGVVLLIVGISKSSTLS